MKNVYIIFLLTWTLLSCNGNGNDFDASGVFETEEIIVSSEVPGRVSAFSAMEGDKLEKGKSYVQIDSTTIMLQIQQAKSRIKSLGEKKLDVQPQLKWIDEQIKVLQTQWEVAESERQRVVKLVKAEAATQKQLDDILYQQKVLQQQILAQKQQLQVQKNNTGSQNRAVLSEREPLEKGLDILYDQLIRSSVKNPIDGILLSKYAYEGEVVGMGKALYKVARLDPMILRAYVTAEQVTKIQLGEEVEVFIDESNNTYRSVKGKVQWISAQAEFTPKTIQTKDERANLVYAIKLSVPNDGNIKIGMYGELKFSVVK